MMGAELRPCRPNGAGAKKSLLINGGQHLSRAALEGRPVRDGRNPEGALFRLYRGLGDIDPPNVRRRDTLGR